MARSRILKPEFFANDLAQLSPHARLLFAGLWTLADRSGRLRDRPIWIRGQLFPYEPDVDVDSLIRTLVDRGFLVRYRGECAEALPSHRRHRADVGDPRSRES